MTRDIRKLIKHYDETFKDSKDGALYRTDLQTIYDISREAQTDDEFTWNLMVNAFAAGFEVGMRYHKLHPMEGVKTNE